MKSTYTTLSLILATGLMALLGSASVQAECRAGAYTIINGNTMEHEGERFRLKGVKAPAEGEPYVEASEKALQSLIVMNCPVRCFISGRTEDGMAVAVCYGGDASDINAAMVRQGFARADPDQPDYVSQEQQARAEKAGLWSGKPLQETWTWPSKVERQEQIDNPESDSAGEKAKDE